MVIFRDRRLLDVRRICGQNLRWETLVSLRLLCVRRQRRCSSCSGGRSNEVSAVHQVPPRCLSLPFVSRWIRIGPIFDTILRDPATRRLCGSAGVILVLTDVEYSPHELLACWSRQSSFALSRRTP